MFNPINFKDAGASFAQGIFEGAKNSFANSGLGEGFSSTVAEIAVGTFSKIAANMSSSAEFGQQLGSKFADIAKNAFEATDWSGSGVGSNMGGGVNDFFHHLMTEANMKDITGDFMKEISDAFKEGVTKIDMKGNMEHLATEFDDGMGVFRENFIEQLDLFRGDVQSLFANMARDTTLKMLPWVALGSAILIGTPLLTHYAYKKAVHNIGRPQLAQEIRKVGIWDRTTDGVSRTVSSVWNATKSGIKWGALAGAAGVTLATTGAIASRIMTGDSGIAGEMMGGLGCAMGMGSYYCNPEQGLPLIAAAFGAGMISASSNLTSNFYSYVKQAVKKDEQPVFDAALQKRIDDLTTATYNINRNGGFMQNLLLYGPGGTGKTMVSKYIAKHSNMNYVMMSGGDLAQYIKRGEHVTELNKLFAEAKNSHSPTILFIDECESLCGDRGNMDKSELIELVNSFLNQTGEPSKKVMVILTTNRQEDLDPAVLSRMDHKLYIGPPQLAERKKIVEMYLPTFMTSQERKNLFTDKMVAKIAQQTEGFTGRTIFKMLNTLSGMRAATKDNKLTEQMVTDTVNAFVKQEADILKRTEASKTNK